jgi:hypothetical protein
LKSQNQNSHDVKKDTCTSKYKWSMSMSRETSQINV